MRWRTSNSTDPHNRVITADMSSHLIAITGLVYAYVSAEQFWRGNPGMGYTYAGYAFANIGLWMMAK